MTKKNDNIRRPGADNNLDSTPARKNLSKIARFAVKRAADKKLTQVAASLTFTTVLGVVPLLAVILSLFTAFPLFADFRIALENFLASNLMPPAVSANIMDYLNQFAAQASGLTAIGSLALIVTSIMLIRTIDDAFNNIWQVEHQRPMRQRILVYWAIISLGPILTGASLWASAIVTQQSLSYIGDLHGGITFILSSTPLLLTGLGFTALFMGVPNCRVYWKDALFGGFSTAIVLALMRYGFALYLMRFPSYTVIYGAFATLPIFLLWMYMSWLAVLFGATMAATLPAIRQRRWDLTQYPGSLFVDAVNVLSYLWDAQKNSPPGQTTHALASQAGLHTTELMHVLSILKDLGYVADSEYVADGEHDDVELWILVRDPRSAKLRPLIEALLIDTQQPGLSLTPQLPRAIAAVLSGGTVHLETLFEQPQTLAQMAYIRQNEGTVSKEASSKEANHAKSQ